MMVRIFDHGQNPQAASDAPRWCLDQDNVLTLEAGYPEKTIAELRRRGHRIGAPVPTFVYGGAQLIQRLDRGYCGASDHRKDGQAVGF
jgi:gamma-glutamyltranspeptidase/glutathione hydrolase